MKCYVATSNPGKLKEICSLAEEYFPQRFEFVGRAAKHAPEVADTFLGNAKIKSFALLKELQQEGELFPFCVLADDSGLCVDVLNGEPGVLSARYAGDHVSDELHGLKLLEVLKEKNILKLEERSAHYTCAISFLVAEKMGVVKEFFTEGIVNGYIGFEPRGQSGFGYDPIFHGDLKGKTFGELSYEEKNANSHRRNALQKLKELTK